MLTVSYINITEQGHTILSRFWGKSWAAVIGRCGADVIGKIKNMIGFQCLKKIILFQEFKEVAQ